MLILADPSSSVNSNANNIFRSGSDVTQLTVPVPGYVVTGAKTIQVEHQRLNYVTGFLY